MKHIALYLSGLVLFLGLFGCAHRPPERPWFLPLKLRYNLPAIPDDRIPIFDGDLSDWEWLPKQFIHTRDTAPRKTQAIRAGKVSKEDFDCVVYGPAWIPKMNMWAFAVKITDDMLFTPLKQLTECWMEDHLQWCIDADNSGGIYRGPGIDSQQAQQYFFTPKQGGHMGLFHWPQWDRTLWWSLEEPWCHKGFLLDEKTGSYTLEVAIALWDHLDPEGPEKSVRHIMQPGQLIGATFMIGDRDEKDSASISWRHLSDPACDADVFDDFHLWSVGRTLNVLEAQK